MSSRSPCARPSPHCPSRRCPPGTRPCRGCASWCGGRRAEALQALDALAALAAAHFQREESVLRKLSGYPALDAHAGEHRTRLDQLTALRLRFQKAEAGSVSRQLCDDLVHWFVRQSIGHDAAIKGHFDDRGTRLAGRSRPRKAS